MDRQIERDTGVAPIRRRRVRRWLLGVLAFVVVATMAAVGGIAWHFSSVAVEIVRKVERDTTASPAGPGRVSMPAEKYALLPGEYGLVWDGGSGAIGQIVARGGSTVTRTFTAASGTLLAPGTPVSIDPYRFTGDPKSARGLDFRDVTVPGELGDYPAWYVPAEGAASGAGRTWLVFVHGRGASRAEALRYLPAAHAADLPTLVITYRNDVGAPASADGVYHLGDTEWRDVEAGVRYALDAGARDVVLVGWSMGAALSLQMVDRSSLSPSVRALLLDSPVLDWRDVFVYQGGERGLPAPLSRLSAWVVERRQGIDLDRFDWVERSARLRLPTLMFASDGDSYVPNEPALRVAAARPDLVELVNTPGADHVRSWNVDPAGFEDRITAWLTKVGAAQPVSVGAGQ